MKKTSQSVSFVQNYVYNRPLKKNRGGKVGFTSAKVGRGTNKVKTTHMSVEHEKSSLEKDVLFWWEHCRDASRTTKSRNVLCYDDEDSMSSETSMLLPL